MVPVVQLVRASDCGSECRGFESHRAPQQRKAAMLSFFLFIEILDILDILESLVLSDFPELIVFLVIIKKKEPFGSRFS